MAVSEVGICNAALAHIGDAATVSSINPPEGSVQSEHCQRFYPMARDTLLEMHPWNFSTRRVSSPAERTSETTVWAHAYVLPENPLKVFSVLPPQASGNYTQPWIDNLTDQYLPYTTGLFATQPFEIEILADGTPVVYTNQDQAEIRYAVKIEDPTRFSPLFVNTLSRLLASYLAGPVIKGTEGINVGIAQYRIFATLLVDAKASDSDQRRGPTTHMPSWLGARA
jgi:hypothetical protein